MASETTLRPGELKDVLLKEIEAANLGAVDVSEVGTILEVRDGVARIYGLKNAIAGEMLEFTSQETGEVVTGLVLNLEQDNVGAAIMGDFLKLKEGDEARCTGRLLEVPVGPAMLGRVPRAVSGTGCLTYGLVVVREIFVPSASLRPPVSSLFFCGCKASSDWYTDCLM